MEAPEEEQSMEYTPTWIVAILCSIIVIVSLFAERALHRLGKCLKRKNQDALFEALRKLKEELMLLGFISFLLTVSRGAITKICIPENLASYMLPCKLKSKESSHQATTTNGRRRLLSSESGLDYCARKDKVPLLSLEAMHQLHIFIFVLAVVHVIFCATTMVLGGAKIRQWEHWENDVHTDKKKPGAVSHMLHNIHGHHHEFLKQRTVGYWRKAAVVSWVMSFFKQFYGSVTKSDYIVLRQGFIKAHCGSSQNFNFHKYMMRTLSVDFKKVVGISWHLWLFVVIFLLLNIAGWHTYFWLSFLPLILLLLVGAKLEHIITLLAQEITMHGQNEHTVRPSDEHFWFNRPGIVLYLIHFVLFQNSFEIAFFFWIWTTYGFDSCIMEDIGYIITRLIIGVIVQLLCSYSTLPLYALVSQMGSMFKQSLLNDHVRAILREWAQGRKSKPQTGSSSAGPSGATSTKRQMQQLTADIVQQASVEENPLDIEANSVSMIRLTSRS